MDGQIHDSIPLTAVVPHGNNRKLDSMRWFLHRLRTGGRHSLRPRGPLPKNAALFRFIVAGDFDLWPPIRTRTRFLYSVPTRQVSSSYVQSFGSYCVDSFVVSVLTLIPTQLAPLPPPSFTPNSITVILSTTTYLSLRSPASNRSRTLLPVLLLKLPNAVTSLLSYTLFIGSK